jgi:ribosomal subunit interface protein
MQIITKATGLGLTPSLKKYVDMKLGSLDRLVRKFELQGEVEMRLEVARTTAHHRKGPVFMAEANLRLPYRILRAVHNDADVRTAIDMIRAKLALEIKKYKAMHAPRARRTLSVD